MKHVQTVCARCPSQHQLQSYPTHIAGKFDGELNLWLGWKCLIKSANIIFTLHTQWCNACSNTLGSIWHPSRRAVHVVRSALAHCQLCFLQLHTHRFVWFIFSVYWLVREGRGGKCGWTPPTSSSSSFLCCWPKTLYCKLNGKYEGTCGWNYLLPSPSSFFFGLPKKIFTTWFGVYCKLDCSVREDVVRIPLLSVYFVITCRMS